MDSFVVSSLKYRPQSFDDVVGQGHVTTTLKNAIQSNRLGQAFLFCGPRGVGKTTCARILAKVVNSKDPVAALSQEHPGNERDLSYNIFEIDAASHNTVDQMRAFVEQVRFPPQTGKYKIYIIDEVHMLSTQAFNAFLKTLEEPPEYVIFILATTEKHKLLPTIVSRCQTFNFNRISVGKIAERMAAICDTEGIKYEQEALFMIGRKADGALRDALSMLDQLTSFSEGHLTEAKAAENLNIIDSEQFLAISQHIFNGDHQSGLILLNTIINKGYDTLHFVTGLAEHWRNLLLIKESGTAQILELGEKLRDRLEVQSKDCSVSVLLSGLSLLSETEVNYRFSHNQRLHTELVLLKLSHIKEALEFDSIELVKKKDNSRSQRQELEVKEDKKGPEPIESSIILEDQEPITADSNLVQSPNSFYENSDKIEEPVKVVLPEPPKDVEAHYEVDEEVTDMYTGPKLTNLSHLRKEVLKDFGEKDQVKWADTLDPDLFRKAWKEKIDQTEKESGFLHKALELSSLNILEKSVEITFPSVIAKEQFQEQLQIVLPAFREKCLFQKLELILLVTEIKKTENDRPYSDKEIYEHFVKQNKTVEELRKRFNLDIEY